MERNGQGQPRIVLFQQDLDDGDNHSELDLDLYDADETPERFTRHGLSVSAMPSILQQQQGPNRGQTSFGSSFSTVSEQATDGASSTTSHPRYNAFNALDGTTASVSSGSMNRNGRRPVDPNTRIRTDFTTTNDVGTPKEDYGQLCTPPGDPPSSRPEPVAHPAYTKARRTELYMRAEWVFGLMILGIGIGLAIESQKPEYTVSYWFTVIGSLYVRLVACITLPMTFCQVVIGAAELANSHRLLRAWVHMVVFIVLCSFFSVLLSTAITAAFHSKFAQQNAPNLSLIHPPFAFKCPNGKYMELQADGTLGCTAKELNVNATFPYLVDLNRRLGINDPVATVDESGLLVSLFEVYFPGNLVEALSKNNYLSVVLLATVIGIAVAKSFTTPPGNITRSRNPLFRLLTHIYVSLFRMHEWIQILALVSTVPLFIGAMLEIPDIYATFGMAQYYISAVMLGAFVQCLVVVPLMFYVIVRENPFAWVWQMLAPIGYGAVLSYPFFTIGHMTKAALRTKKISPAMFGSIYPVLTVMQRSTFSLGFPTALVSVAAYSGCNIEMDAGDFFKIFGLSFMVSFGDTMLATYGMAVFLTMWRAFCSNEDVPPAVLMISTMGIVITRFGAAVGVMVDVMLVRMVAHICEPSVDQPLYPDLVDAEEESAAEHFAHMQRPSESLGSVKSTAI
ncbi:hypothetical protein Poli38472_004616 [Pythium oligandrum]|uniref:Amino acid transporter n=1 Tax=Pythium oligandrum TaxID=41045 RepID=A0A8K1CBY4_PYTOL|nr:hypothetical protein Poli38472_004616 [Pythium oligandrum]|eukprot:TMW59547.1 hypothetical protein Poli38472_004616 [Pythium oligandrum]